MSSVPDTAELLADATWLSQAFDPPTSLVRFVRLTSESYRSASFLDDRMFQFRHDVEVRPFEDVRDQLPAEGRRDARWIFHIGHVGSTLVARMLGEVAGVLSVREPRILRDFASLAAQRRADLCEPLQLLLSRTLADEETALVKATSFVSEVASELLQPGSRALLIYAKPSAYIPSILAGENSVKELRLLAPSRAERMRVRVGVQANAMNSDAQRAAAAWACEMTALEALADGREGQLMWVDFDSMLADVPGYLRRICAFLGFPASEAELRRIASGPLLTRYSKDLQFEYSPDLRRELLAQATREHRPAIGQALAMLDAVADASPYLKRALERARTEI